MVELTLVIVMIAVLAAVGMGIFGSKSTYTERMARDLLVSRGLLAHQVALGMSASAVDPVTLTVSATADDWVFSLDKANSLDVSNVTSERGSATMSIDGASLGTGDSYTFTWNTDAGLSSNSNHEIQISGAQTNYVCFSAAGYVYDKVSACP